jgi:environmental stress-induced protein Ves
VRVIPHDSLVAAPWANGGGITREIAAERDADGILWRLSLADVGAEGPFSAFAGLQRILTVIEGAGMVLETPGAPIAAAPLAPVRFAGDLAVTGRLPHGPIRDLNVIWRPGRVEAGVTVHSGPGDIAPAGGGGAVFLVSGAARIGGRLLAPLTTVLDPDQPVVAEPGAQALCITLRRRP